MVNLDSPEFVKSNFTETFGMACELLSTTLPLTSAVFFVSVKLTETVCPEEIVFFTLAGEEEYPSLETLIEYVPAGMLLNSAFPCVSVVPLNILLSS